ncbi:MAG: hypothetical protein KC592_19740 [Nitrospira sp.]|nr:hypothetical protein [Nitrospira sp.]
MNQPLEQLIPAIATYAKDKDIRLSKTKLLKLLYLFDVEYYRQHGATFTGFQWKFFHLGPWTNEYDPILEGLVRSGALLAKPYSTGEYEGCNYEPVEECDFSPIFPRVKDEMALRNILSVWAEKSLGEILDHIYFRTEPMEQGIRNAPLDFSLIPSQSPEPYRRSSSGKTSKELAHRRKQFGQKQKEFRQLQNASFEFTPPRFDEEFYQALSKLNEASA